MRFRHMYCRLKHNYYHNVLCNKSINECDNIRVCAYCIHDDINIDSMTIHRIRK